MHITLKERLLALYDALNAHFPHEPHWWPIITEVPLVEMIVGAVLVQQTRWETVEAAVRRLEAIGWLDPAALAKADTDALAALIRPCAFHTQKAPGLQAIFRAILERYGGHVGAMLAQERAPLRAELLALPRIGRETADTIMLYGGGKAVFIVDAYARRLFARLDLVPGFDFLRAPYDAVQRLVETELAGLVDERGAAVPGFLLPISHPADPAANFYRQFHALIVEECIHHCLATRQRQDRPGARRVFVDPRKCAEHCLTCQGCPVKEMCATYEAGVIPEEVVRSA